MLGDHTAEEPEGAVSMVKGQGRTLRSPPILRRPARGVAETRRVELGSRAPLGSRTSTQARATAVGSSGVAFCLVSPAVKRGQPAAADAGAKRKPGPLRRGARFPRAWEAPLERKSTGTL